MKQIKNDFQKLVESLRDENKQGLDELVTRFFQSCFFIVKKNGGTIDDAKEFFQDVALSLLLKLKDDEFHVRHLPAYLKKSFFNTWVRKKQNDKSNLSIGLETIKLSSEETDFESLAQKEIYYNRMDEKLKLLTIECQKVLNAFFYEGLADKETAVQMNYSIKFVKNKRQRCIKNLRKLMGLNKNNDGK